ncbi:MAG: HupE/UreJ family protein [Phycisphaerales bacterium JB063]
MDALLHSALAHVGPHPETGGFFAGLTHPWLGLDHLLAMVAVGLLAVLASDRKALWQLPAVFIGAMLVGGTLAFFGVPFLGVEALIAGSVVVLGLAVAVWKNVALLPAIGLVGLAGCFHGYAHIVEMHGGLAAYAAGMALGTAALHGLGIALGLGMLQTRRELPVRIAGAALAVCFAASLLPWG